MTNACKEGFLLKQTVLKLKNIRKILISVTGEEAGWDQTQNLHRRKTLIQQLSGIMY